MLPGGRAKVWPVKLGQLVDAIASNRCSGTLFIPPSREPTVDLEMAARLGIAETGLNADSHMPSWRLSDRLLVVG